MKSSVLVTGGAGFIGSHLTEKLISDGHQVFVLDDLSTGKMSNIPSAAEFIEGCATDRPQVTALIEKVEQVFHLAAVSSVQASRDNWVRSHQVNQTSTVTILDAIAQSAKAEKPSIMFTSSAAIYGDSQVLPITEDEPKNPLSAYAADKLASEYHVRVAAKTRGVKASVVRPFNVYGPRQDPSSPYSGVISIFHDRLSRNEAINIYGDGEQSRDFIFVEDIVEFMARSMAEADFSATPYNLCTGRSVTINQLAETFRTILRSSSPIEYLEERRAEVRHSLGSNARAIQKLGHVPNFNIMSGLKKMLSHSRR